MVQINWISHLNLQPHPEGGYYREIFRSNDPVTRAGDKETRSACTSIYYLLEGTDFSGFHRIASDELWYFHKGAPLLIHVIDQSGEYSSMELSDEPAGQLSLVVEAGKWFAAEIPSKSGFTLVSCAVAPGFEFTEFEMARRDALLSLCPEPAALISRLCR